MTTARPTLLLSIDYEDWHQLVRRRLGVAGWEAAGPALARQTEALLKLLDELHARATFFVLGMAARAHPDLLRPIVEAGHEIACHGDAHRLVHSQTPEEFGADLRAAKATIAELTGRTPIGYRAPAFSITRASDWAYEVLAGEGFLYDASQHDSPIGADHPEPDTARTAPHRDAVTTAPHRLQSGLWEFPVAVWHTDRAKIPVGGASYWQVLPRPLVLTGLKRAGSMAGLYLHPYELDPQPLKVMLGAGATPSQRAHARLRQAQRNGARRRAPGMLRAIARRFELLPYGEAYARLGGENPGTLPP
jgi:peptidoglycan-N-acetylglucosamine deacetylase